MSNINWESFGSSVDLCVIENAYMEEVMEDEAFLAEAGTIIDKARLKDESYVKELIRDIKDGKVKYNWGSLLVTIIFTTVPLNLSMLLPATLCNVILYKITTGLTESERKEKSTKKVLSALNKMITKCESELSKTSDKDEKAALKKQIDKLKHNKELLLKD